MWAASIVINVFLICDVAPSAVNWTDVWEKQRVSNHLK